MTEIWELEANEISDLFLKKKISSIEIVDSLEKRLNEINPKINSIPENTFKYAKKKAIQLDKKIANNEKLGPLAGVPMTVKINTDQIGFASTNGLKIQKNLVA